MIIILTLFLVMIMILFFFWYNKDRHNKPNTPSFPTKKITPDTPFHIYIEQDKTNFGHIGVIQKGVSFSERSDHVFSVYNDEKKDPAITGYRLDPFLTDLIVETQEGRIVSMDDKYFELYRYSLWRKDVPNSTDSPSLSLSLFKPHLEKKDYRWASRYFASQLKLIIMFNYFFPKGSVRSYLDFYMLEVFKVWRPDEFHVGSLIESPRIQFDTTCIDGNKLFARFDKFMEDNPLPADIKNGYEKFIYYYTIASKIYNDTDSDDTIRNNKGGDFFVYHLKGDFTETVIRPGNISYEAHATDGYIGQLMRYICLRQQDYMYQDRYLVRRNKHYVFRDGHENQTSLSDAEVIDGLNKAARDSRKKIYNMIPSNQYYRAPWHEFVSCPANPKEMQIRSAIAGVVQMTNFTKDPKWLNDTIYNKTIGLAFLLDMDEKTTLRRHRPLQDAYEKGVLKEYMYGVEEYMFYTLFSLDYFKNQNIYYPDRFMWDVYRLQKPSGNEYVEWNKPILKAQIILFLYLVKNKLLKDPFNSFDFYHAIEKLRNTPPTDKLERKWLSFFLAIYPTKYFIQPTIFSKGFSAREMNMPPEETSYTTQRHVLTQLNLFFRDFDIYDTPMNEWTYDRLSQLEFMTCNSPIINSNVEWCVEPYLDQINQCPPDDFFSGFYQDKPKCLEYGIFRQPSEIKDVISALEKNKDNIILYKNYLHYNPTIKKIPMKMDLHTTRAQHTLHDTHKNWKDVFDSANLFD